MWSMPLSLLFFNQPGGLMHFQNELIHDKDIVCYILISNIYFLYVFFFYNNGQLINKFFLYKIDFSKIFNIRYMYKNSFTTFIDFWTPKYLKIRGPGVTSLTRASKANTLEICKILIPRCSPILPLGGLDLNKKLLRIKSQKIFPNF